MKLTHKISTTWFCSCPESGNIPHRWARSQIPKLMTILNKVRHESKSHSPMIVGSSFNAIPVNWFTCYFIISPASVHPGVEDLPRDDERYTAWSYPQCWSCCRNKLQRRQARYPLQFHWRVYRPIRWIDISRHDTSYTNHSRQSLRDWVRIRSHYRPAV